MPAVEINAPSNKYRTDGPEFSPPPVARGDEVLWYPSATRSNLPEVARVRQVNGNVVELLVLSGTGVQTKYSVRHMDDPRARDPRIIRNGGWEHMPNNRDKQLSELRELVEKLQTRVEGLEKRGR